MHELSITRNIVAIVGEAARGRKVVRVTLEIGALAGVVPASIEFCFEVVAKGTPVEGATLEILATAGAELSVKTMEIEEAS